MSSSRYSSNVSARRATSAPARALEVSRKGLCVTTIRFPYRLAPGGFHSL
jgi:hypothetical protein